MKRKRAVGRRKPTRKANVAGADKGTENLKASNAGDQSGWSDDENNLMNTRTEVDIAQAKATNSRGPTESLKNDKSMEKTSRGNSLHGNNVFKDVASFAAKLSRAVGSSTADPRIDATPLQDEMTNAGEQTSTRHDPLDNKKELNAALSVIKTIMKMDSAKPFNSPVDPVALAIPDYFDIIDTPMDFDTICNNIDLGFKYRNSEDIYRDVELIWDNCSKYNKKGTKIIELMKQVKTKFLKLWSAAGLYIPRQEPSNGQSGKSLLHAVEDSVRHNYRGHTHLDGSMISNSIHEGNPFLMGQELHRPHPSCCSYEYRLPPISSQCSCSGCFRGSQPSMYHNSWHNSPGGPSFEKHYNHERSHHLQFHERQWQHQPSFNSQNPGSSNAYSDQQKQRQMYSSHIDGYQPGLTHADDHQHHSNIPHFMCHEPGGPSTYSAGHTHLNQPMEDITRHAKRVQEELTALDPDGSSFQKHPQLAATQANSCSRKHSPARHEGNSGSAGHAHVTAAGESSVRRTPCRPESSVAPNCSSEEHQMNQNEPDSPLSEDSATPVPEEDGHLSQPGSTTPEHTRDSPALKKKTRGRGPTRCHKYFIEGERISITTDELGQPVGVDVHKLVRFLGTIARDGHKAPLNYIDWRAMPETHKENMWKEVQKKIIIDPKSKYWIMKSISAKWKNWKNRLKTERYLSRSTNEERLANLDERVLPDQWQYLVSHWNSEEAQRRSAINKASAAKLVFRHTIGSKSVARLREEQMEKRADKTPPSRAELFILTRMRKDGKPVNEETSAIIEKLQQNQDTTQTSTAQDEAFTEIVGRRKNGQVRCAKLGSSPSALLPRKHSQDVANQLVLEAKAEVLEMKNKMGTMEETCAQMAAQMATMMSMMSSLQKNISNGNMHVPVNNTAGIREELPLQTISSIPSRTRSSRKKTPLNN